MGTIIEVLQSATSSAHGGAYHSPGHLSFSISFAFFDDVMERCLFLILFIKSTSLNIYVHKCGDLI
jgi:hypothetical protein